MGAVKLRDNPLFRYCGIKSWPPIWVQCNSYHGQVVIGEVGVLTAVRFEPMNPYRLFLGMEHDLKLYSGCMLFSTAVAYSLSCLLHYQVGRSIVEIGDLDTSLFL